MFVGESGVARIVERTAECLRAAASRVPRCARRRHQSSDTSTSGTRCRSTSSAARCPPTPRSSSAPVSRAGPARRSATRTTWRSKGVYEMDVYEEGRLVRRSVPLRSAMNEVLRDAYVEDCQKALEPLEPAARRAGAALVLPSRRFHRHQGDVRGTVLRPRRSGDRRRDVRARARGLASLRGRPGLRPEPRRPSRCASRASSRAGSRRPRAGSITSQSISGTSAPMKHDAGSQQLERRRRDPASRRRGSRRPAFSLGCGAGGRHLRELREWRRPDGRRARRLGVQEEQRVLVILPDGPEYVYAFLAPSGRRGAGPREHLSRAARLPAVPARDTCAGGRHHRGRARRTRRRSPRRAPGRGSREIGLAVAGIEECPRRPSRFRPPDDPAFWLYSSGTTGAPKAVIHRHRDILHAVAAYGRHVLDLRPDDRAYATSKLFFATASARALLSARAGASAVASPEPFSAGADMDESSRGTSDALLSPCHPSIARSSSRRRGNAPQGVAGLRRVVSAGEAAAAGALPCWQCGAFGQEILDGLAPRSAAHLLSNRPGACTPGSPGRPVPGYDVRVSTRAVCPWRRNSGGLLVRGDSIAGRILAARRGHAADVPWRVARDRRSGGRERRRVLPASRAHGRHAQGVGASGCRRRRSRASGDGRRPSVSARSSARPTATRDRGRRLRRVYRRRPYDLRAARRARMRRAARFKRAESASCSSNTCRGRRRANPALGAARAPRWHTLNRGRVLRTPLCDLLGIELPIVAAPMGPSLSSAGDRRIVVRRPAHPVRRSLGGAAVGDATGDVASMALLGRPGPPAWSIGSSRRATSSVGWPRASSGSCESSPSRPLGARNETHVSGRSQTRA